MFFLHTNRKIYVKFPNLLKSVSPQGTLKAFEGSFYFSISHTRDIVSALNSRTEGVVA